MAFIWRRKIIKKETTITVGSYSGFVYNNNGDVMFKEYLKERKLSVYKLSEISNVPYTTLNELINGKKSIEDCKIKTIENIAKALNCSIETLLNLLNGKNIVILNSWEVETRCNDNFVALLEDINDVKKIADELIEYCDKQVKFVDIE